MRNALPIALTLLALAIGAWILLSSADEPEPGSIDGPNEWAGSDDPDLMRSHEGLAGRGTAPSGVERRKYKPIDPRTVPRGTIEVLPVGPDLSPVPNHHLKVYVEPLGLKDWRKQLGHYDDETGAWTFDKVLAGEIEVRIFGDHVIATKHKAKVRAGGTSRTQVHVDLAGAIHYQVKLRDGTEPKDVTLSLLDMDDKPVAAYHESRSARRMTMPRVAKTSVQGPQGAVFGLPAGRYRLRVETGEHGYTDAVVDVEVSRTQKVKLELGR